ncbi:MAG: apolipoprotein N-acyltransferase [Acidobacteria bacterium]|nr:apolipoprotein N-acyltransferase [Acidobacteriota bacterium]
MIAAAALAALSGALQVLTFPRFSIYYLAALSIAPLLLALARADALGGPSRKRRFLLGWLAGTIFWGGSCYWIYGVMHDYSGVPAVGAAAIFAAFSVVKGLHLGVFGLLAGPLLRRSWATPAIAALWVAIEGTHQYLAFTWLHLGNAAAAMTVLAPLAPYTGVYGLSFALAMMNVALALVLLRRPRKQLAWLAPLALLPLLPALPEDEVGSHEVRLVQPAVHPDELLSGNWTSQRAGEHYREMLRMSTADPTTPELLVWPEYSVPLYYFDSEPQRMLVELVARKVNAPFLFNSVTFREEDGEKRPLNSAILIAPDGELLAYYSKMHLVPFGEFVPWPFSLFINKITMQAGNFLPGDKVVVAEANGHKIGAYICYENVFARGVRQFVAQGAEVLVNISNDSWYGRTAARYQHLLIARMRAIENQRWILRATSDGITTVINRAGQITTPLPSFEPGVLNSKFDYSDEMTWFALYGEWFWYLCLATTPALLWFSRKS